MRPEPVFELRPIPVISNATPFPKQQRHAVSITTSQPPNQTSTPQTNLRDLGALRGETFTLLAPDYSQIELRIRVASSGRSRFPGITNRNTPVLAIELDDTINT
ncbi:MAG: hypothetical protein Q7Q71_03930 [Verrucomicrobiota bacterium JB023]|nr:hypothetical protein [Verrucomicrobiota bacterium JB023]